MIDLQIIFICLGCYKKCHSLGNLNSRHLVIIVLKAGNSKIKVPNYMVLSKGSLSGLQTVVFLLCLHIWAVCQERELKNRYFWIAVQKTLESPLDSQEFKPVNPKGNQLCIFIGRTDVEAEAPSDALMLRTYSLEKILMLGKVKGRWRRANRVWDSWMASSTQWTWVWENSRR